MNPRRSFARWRALALALACALFAATTAAQPRPNSACGVDSLACSDAGAARAADNAPTVAPERAPSASAASLTVYWGVGCPHCEQARPVVNRLAAERGVTVEWVEVRSDPVGRARFEAVARRFDLRPAGVPTFVAGPRYVMGFYESDVRALIEGTALSDPSRRVQLPLFGTIDPSRLSLPAFALLVGLADGFNPCAFYVLVVLLSVLLHAKSRARLALYGSIFVVMSGVVYFVFMTAWLGLFSVTGVSRSITTALGVVLLVMGLINVKELVWFKKGVSLMIPESAKPTLFRRMRQVASSASLPAAALGITALAAVVNLVELGCTLGLPAMFTRVLSLRAELSPAKRLAYVALYNVAYVIPLAVIVAIASVTFRKLTLSERRAKALKGFSGALLLLFGALFIIAPDLLR